MTSLLDITNAPRSVEIQGKSIPVHGLSGEVIAQLMLRFPELGKALSSSGRSALTRESLAKLAPELLGAILAAATGHAGEADHEAAARRLSIGDQAILLDEAVRVTFPRGLGPLLETLTGLVGSVGGLDQAGLSAMLSQQQSASSPEQATDGNKSGG